MEKTLGLKLSRRDFIGCASGFMLGNCFLDFAPLRLYGKLSIQELKEELTPEEQKLVEKSQMAQDLNNYFGKGYSCAESLFMVSLRFLKKPEELVWISAGFGGGIYHKDLCGFLTSVIMAIGLNAGMLEKERKEKKDHVKSLVNQYWKWWTSQAPLHCSEIRKKGTSSKVCRRLGQLAAAKIEELLGSGLQIQD
jgi:hypothetical protein